MSEEVKEWGKWKFKTRGGNEDLHAASDICHFVSFTASFHQPTILSIAGHYCTSNTSSNCPVPRTASPANHATPYQTALQPVTRAALAAWTAVHAGVPTGSENVKRKSTGEGWDHFAIRKGKELLCHVIFRSLYRKKKATQILEAAKRNQGIAWEIQVDPAPGIWPSSTLALYVFEARAGCWARPPKGKMLCRWEEQMPMGEGRSGVINRQRASSDERL